MIRPPILAWICLISLALAGCGAHVGATVKPTPPKKRSQPIAAAPTLAPYATAETVSDTPTPAETATAMAGPSPTNAPTSQAQPTSAAPVVAQLPGRLVSASLSPLSVAAGGLLTARVQTSGTVGRVDLYLGSGAPAAAGPLTFSLTPLGGGLWGASGSAPSIAGTYHFTVALYVNGKRTIIDNDSWNVQVVGGSSGSSGSATTQTMPADIPLAPPFSYGDPTAAVFSAAGQTINGSEVTSTTRPDIAPSVVLQWYEAHLPRAGWNVDQSTLPPPGAASFTIVGTSGNRVCVVQYGASTVHIFYGNTSG